MLTYEMGVARRAFQDAAEALEAVENGATSRLKHAANGSEKPPEQA